MSAIPNIVARPVGRDVGITPGRGRLGLETAAKPGLIAVALNQGLSPGRALQRHDGISSSCRSRSTIATPMIGIHANGHNAPNGRVGEDAYTTKSTKARRTSTGGLRRKRQPGPRLPSAASDRVCVLDVAGVASRGRLEQHDFRSSATETATRFVLGRRAARCRYSPGFSSHDAIAEVEARRPKTLTRP